MAAPRKPTATTRASGAKKPASNSARPAEAPAVAATARKGVGYVALLRGVSPMNAKMPELKRCFEKAGFTDVKTVIASGNVVFRAPRAAEATIAKRARAAMDEHLAHPFPVIVRTIDDVAALLASDPWKRYRLPAGSKRVVTFLRSADVATPLPAEVDGARILYSSAQGEVLTAYVPTPRGPVFMALLERTFGRDITTRTWETLERIVKAAG